VCEKTKHGTQTAMGFDDVTRASEQNGMRGVERGKMRLTTSDLPEAEPGIRYGIFEMAPRS
jgi:hypothetical protein